MSRTGCRVLIMLIVAGADIGCGSHGHSKRDGLNSDNPATKLYAIRQANHEDLPQLVEQLDSDDPVVRMMAIQSLQRLTNTRLNYNPYGSIVNRRLQAKAWARAITNGQFEPQTKTHNAP